MTAVTQRYGPSHVAFLIVPLVGAFFLRHCEYARYSTVPRRTVKRCARGARYSRGVDEVLREFSAMVRLYRQRRDCALRVGRPRS